VTRRIDEIAANLGQRLRDLASRFEAFSLPIDESTDVSHTVQLSVLVRRCDAEINITEYQRRTDLFYWSDT
jgi:hypothetical protein